MFVLRLLIIVLLVLSPLISILRCSFALYLYGTCICQLKKSLNHLKGIKFSGIMNFNNKRLGVLLNPVFRL